MTDLNALTATILPHSYPFLLIDKIIELEVGRQVTCIKNVTINEEFFQGHFKDNPIMPGVLIIEAMAQASGLIIGEQTSGAYLTRVTNAKFRKPVTPGDQLVIKSSLLQRFHPLYVFDVTVYVKEEMVSDAEITLAMV